VRHLSLGKDHATAAREGTDEIGLAVMATTFAIVAVFVPIAFMSGVIGRFFFQFGMTVAVAVLVSLFISFTLDPMLSSVWHDPAATRFKYAPWLGRFMAWIERGIDAVHVIYGRVLRWALAHRKTVIGIAVVSFFGSFAIVPLVGTEFMPQTDQSFISLRLNTPVGSSLEYTDTKVREVESVLQKFPEIELAMTSVGIEDGRNYARVNLKLVERAKRSRSQMQLEGLIRDSIRPVPGIELAIGYDRPIWFNLLGPDADTLSKIAADFAAKVAKVRGIADLETSDKAANPAVSVRLNNDAASDLGITVQQVGATIRPLLAGDTISYWLGPDGQNYEVNVQLSKDDRRMTSDLGNLYLTSNRRGPDGQMRMVPLRQVAELVETSSPQIIKRQDLQRRIGIYANAEGRPAGDVGTDVQKIASAMDLPAGYRLAAAGQQQDMQESFSAAVAALGLAIVFIYLILASQFASFTQPVAIMASLPFSLIGVFLALLLTGTTLNIFSIIGFIMLMGLVTKNAILQDSLLDAGQVRLRPILMTTAAMIGGMLPLALGLGEGGENQAPMGRAIIGGVITSTLLTLVVVPVIYTYLDGWKERRKQSHARRTAAASAPLPRGADD
jgi:multidrug efflux pump subunit AcrB